MSAPLARGDPGSQDPKRVGRDATAVTGEPIAGVDALVGF